MEPIAPGDYRQLMQYGAVGVVALLLLVLVVGMFRQFVNHALEQNKQLQADNHEMQEKMIAAINTLTAAVKEMHSDLARDIGQLFNEVSAITEGSRATRIRPRGGG